MLNKKAINALHPLFGVKIIENPYLPDGWLAFDDGENTFVFGQGSKGPIMLKIPKPNILLEPSRPSSEAAKDEPKHYPAGNCCDNGCFGDGHDCQKKPAAPAEKPCLNCGEEKADHDYTGKDGKWTCLNYRPQGSAD